MKKLKKDSKDSNGGDKTWVYSRKIREIGFTSTFWSIVAIGKKKECWERQGRRAPYGYGHFYPGKKAWPGTAAAHRIALMLHTGGPPLNPELFACHHCDNPPCCNPHHLYWGTAADNAADMKAKLRGTFGTKARHNILTEAEVLLIARFLERHPPRRGPGQFCGYARFLARWFGVSKDAVSDIGLGRWWGWLTEKEYEITNPQYARAST